MKRIRRPDDIELQSGVHTFNQYVEWLLDGDRRFNSSRKTARYANKIEAAVEKGGDLILDDTPCELLQAASEEPTCGYPALVGKRIDGSLVTVGLSRHLLPYLDAIADAEDWEPPKHPKGDAEEKTAEEQDSPPDSG